MSRWFVIKVQSQKEDTVMKNIQERIKAEGLDNIVKRLLVPKEKVKKIKGGKEIIHERKIFPGYILIEVEQTAENFNEKLWHAIKDTHGVAVLLGAGTPIPLSDTEITKILQQYETAEQPKVKIEYNIGDIVKVIDGPFENFEGRVDAVNRQKGIVTIILTVFGRETRVDLEHWQVEKI